MTWTNKKYTAPVVNINGTSGQALIDQQRAVMDACAVLMKALSDSCPHGRDYQISPPEDFRVARDEWETKYKAVIEINDYALALALDIQNQMVK